MLALILAAAATQCAPSAFLTVQSGTLAAVSWSEPSGDEVRLHAVINQSLVLDATAQLRPDGTAVRLIGSSGTFGETPARRERPVNVPVIPWQHMIPHSLEFAVRRAIALGGGATTYIHGASPFSDSIANLTVHRTGPTDWVVVERGKRYEVASDANGCVLSASMPAYGVVFERRAKFSREIYPAWPLYGTPPDNPYRALQVRIPSLAGHVLAGTLTLPRKRKALFPAVVMITGLGEHERNGGSAPWIPFRDLSDALTRAGIAVLRVDDRGVGASTGDRKSSTTSDEADDVTTEVRWLRAQPGIDPSRIALVGHSEGGTIAPMVASRDRSIAAIVCLSGSGVSSRDLARYQTENLVARDPAVPPEKRSAQVEKLLAEELTPRERSFMAIDPISYAVQVRCPAFIGQGGADIYVPPRSAAKLAAAMRAGGVGDVTVRLVPHLGHTLLPDPDGIVQSVFLPAFHVAPEILDPVVRFLTERLRP
jgi:uncharacterized protein